MGVSSTGTLQSFVIRQKDHFVLDVVKPERAVNALAMALVEDLTKTVPGPGKHPLATGNLLKALTTVSALHEDGWVYWKGVGSMSLIGMPGEKDYTPDPIRRFLKEYKEEQAETRAKRQKADAARRADMAARREKLRKERAVEADKAEAAEWYRMSVRGAQSAINKRLKDIQMLQDRWDRKQSVLFNYNTRLERWRPGRIVARTRMNMVNRRNEIIGELNSLRGVIQKKEAAVQTRMEALMRFKQWHSHKIRGR